MTAGTIFDKTRTPLRMWFAAAWYVISQKQGVSALGLQRVLGLSSYQTAWAMLHRFRRAMVRPDRDLLNGTVEVDEAYLALRRGKRVRPKGTSPKVYDKNNLVSIAIAVEVLEPTGFGRIRLRRINAPTTEALMPFVRQNVQPGAKVQQMARPYIAYSRTKDLLIFRSSSWDRRPRHTGPCLACIGLLRCSNGGCLAPIMGR